MFDDLLKTQGPQAILYVLEVHNTEAHRSPSYDVGARGPQHPSKVPQRKPSLWLELEDPDVVVWREFHEAHWSGPLPCEELEVLEGPCDVPG